MSGLFSILNTSKRGMFTQQTAINVTSHNISNANTEGYSRQKATIETTTPFGMPTLNNAATPGQLGTGSQVSSINRIRDSFLDYQVRAETSTKGQFDTRQSYLTEIEGILNEPSDTGISTLVGKFFDSWQELSKNPGSSDARTVVAQQSAALTDELNHTYSALNNLKTNAQSQIQNDVTDINTMLSQIDKLNQQIIGVKVAGNEPNDLMDKRDLLLDQLSSKFNITIDKKDFDGVDVKTTDSNGIKDPSLIKSDPNSDGKRISYISSIEKVDSDPSGTSYKITYYKLGDMTSDQNKMTMIVNNLDDATVKNIDQTKVLWTNSKGEAITADGAAIKDGATINNAQLNLFQPSSGELSGYKSVIGDIDGYIDQLNKMAKAIAFSVNAVHSGMSDTTSSGNPAKDYVPFFVNSSVAKYDSQSQVTNIDDVLNGESDITAGNISINKDILNDVMKIKTRTNDNQFANEADNNIDASGDGARALAIAQLRNSLIKIQDIGSTINSRKDLFDSNKGGSSLTNNGMTITNNTNGMTLDNYFKDTVDKLGIQSQEANRMVTNQEALLNSLDENRQSVSGVSLDEEMANLVQFQHAFSANAKMISTVDELLDVVINGLKK